MHHRIKKIIRMLVAFTAAGILYYFITRLGIAIPCMFHKITGLYCPGCGVSRMCIHLIQLDFYKAFRSNPGVFISLPFLAVLFLMHLHDYIRYNHIPKYKWLTVLEITDAVILIIFGVLRNIPAFAFLAPL